MTVDISIILAGLGGISTVLAIVATILNFRRNSKNEGEVSGALLADITYIKNSIDELRRDQRDMFTKLSALSERIAFCESATDAMRRRLDGQRGRDS